MKSIIVLQRINDYLIDPNKSSKNTINIGHNNYVHLCKRKSNISVKNFLYITRSKDTKDTITYHISSYLLNLIIARLFYYHQMLLLCDYQVEQITADMVCNGIFSIFTSCNVKEIFGTNVTFSFA